MVKDIHQNLVIVEERLRAACARAGRERAEVSLMAVTKTQTAEAVEAALAAGLSLFGENRVQEAAAKKAAVRGQAEWELIGQLQSNKARLAVEHFDRLQSVDRLKLVEVLARLAEEAGRSSLRILLQVNAGDDPGKSGCAVEEAPALVEAIQRHPILALEGLMTIAPLAQTEDSARRCFARLRELGEALRARSGLSLSELSMGMTGDLEIAVEEGSTLVRVGTALFGARD
jgi:PLP dependent protein